MKALMLYPKLAASGITKNRRQYLPYILACSGMVMMYYIVAFLAKSRFIHDMKGGATTSQLLEFGVGIIAVFSAIFLFYTNSFLIRRRKIEFGLYNILGMGKANIALILVCETILIYAVSVLVGLGCGVLFSKLAELVLTRMVGGSASHAFDISGGVIISTLKSFAIIFGLIMLNALRQIHLSKPIELLKSENVGEKPPKANWFLALLGAAMLGVAYYLAIVSKNPLAAVFSFFIAVVLVILATYLLFIAGSVVVCRILQKNKHYYYKTSHFISVSQMAYRMKRNGAGLASICILSTMVLVTFSSTGSLYFGTEKFLSQRYPRDIIVDAYSRDPTFTEAVENIVNEAVGEYGLEKKNEFSYDVLGISGKLSGDRVTLTPGDYSPDIDLRVLSFVTIDDYNRISGKNVTLSDGEVLISAQKQPYDYDTLNIEEYGSFSIVGQADDFITDGDGIVSIFANIYVFVKDEAELLRIEKMQEEVYSEGAASHISNYSGFDLDCSTDTAIEVYRTIHHKINIYISEMGRDNWYGVSVDCLADNRQDFYSLYGGLFFLGILFSIVFGCAAVLIMYYKQISEGFEDKHRFEILQKVGMTKAEIKKSVNSQVLTVFFLPLIASGIHTGFAFPIVSRLLKLFGLNDTLYLALVTLSCFGLFAALYIVTYLITSKSYYKIVSNERRG